MSRRSSHWSICLASLHRGIQSSLAPLSLTSCDHFASSAARKLRNSAGFMRSGTVPTGGAVMPIDQYSCRLLGRRRQPTRHMPPEQG